MVSEALPLGLAYTDHAYVEAGVDRLCTVGTLFGWKSPRLETARVLDLGCGRGGHLLSQAANLPKAQFLGVDLADAHVADALVALRTTGLPNVAFVKASIFDEPWGGDRFDYITAHGLASWIAPDERRKLFVVIERALAPFGIAYVSANVLPGWYAKMAVRDFFLSLKTRDAGVTPEAAVRELKWLQNEVSVEDHVHRDAMAGVCARLAETDAGYLAHEFFAGELHPESITTLLEEARRAGLTYVGDASPAATAVELLSEGARARVLGLCDARGEELIDFIRGTAFRRMAFVRTASAAAQGWQRPRTIPVENVMSLRWLRRPVKDAERAVFAGLPAEAERALALLRERWPHSIDHLSLSAEVSADPRQLAGELVDIWLAAGDLELRALEPGLAALPSDRPLATPVARYHAGRGGSVTNVWHHSVVLDHGVLAWLLARLDGTKGQVELAAELYDDRGSDLRSDQSAAISRGQAETVVALGLIELSRLGLLVA